jgi:hypothetical protein
MAYSLTQSMRLTRANSQYATAADSASLDITGDITIEFWVKIKSQVASGTGWFMVMKSTAGANNRSYELTYEYFGANPILQVRIFNEGTPTNFWTGFITHTLTVDTWTHVAVSVDVSAAAASKAEWLLDGVSQGAGTGTDTGSGSTAIFNGARALRIGQSDPVNAGFSPDAQFSLVRLWSDIRTSTEIANNMCNVFGTSEANMAAEWSLDNVYTDASGNSNTLTGVNTPTFVSDVPSVCGSAPTPSRGGILLAW